MLNYRSLLEFVLDGFGLLSRLCFECLWDWLVLFVWPLVVGVRMTARLRDGD